MNNGEPTARPFGAYNGTNRFPSIVAASERVSVPERANSYSTASMGRRLAIATPYRPPYP